MYVYTCSIAACMHDYSENSGMSVNQNVWDLQHQEIYRT